MAKAGRVFVAVVAGAALWAALWLAGNRVAQAAFPTLVIPKEPLLHAGVLLTYIGYAVLLSVLAGYTTAAAAGKQAVVAVWILAVVQLVFGVIAEVSYWQLTPVWYHVVFLALLVPTTVYGGRLRLRQHRTTAALARA